MILLDFDIDGNILKYKQNMEKISKITTTDKNDENGLLFYQNKLREELKKIKIESKNISEFLKIMGIEHFIIDINEDAEDENIIVKYKSSNIDKNKLQNCLSEGEKTVT